MREIVSYDAKTLADGGIKLSRFDRGIVDEITAKDWYAAVQFLVQPPAGDNGVFTVCFSLHDFTKALFSLLPTEERNSIESATDRIVYQDCKVFYVNGRYLGLTATFQDHATANIYRRAELNLQALKWWVSEDEDEPTDVKQIGELGVRIVKVLDRLGFYPTKLTSPVAVFSDCYLGDARDYPTIFSWPEEKLEAMHYAEEMMRHEWRSAYQVGAFKSTHLYDRVSSYPAAITGLPSTNDCRCEHATARPGWAQWGIMYGEVTVDVDVSPLMFAMDDGTQINPRGKWKDYFTTGEISWLERWGAGQFTIEDGWFFRFGEERPYRKAMNWLYHHKTNPDKFISTVAKKMSQGVSGKLDEDRQDGKKGDLYNPILAGMTRSHTRKVLGDFIYENRLQDDLVAVLVDSVLSTRKVLGLPDATGMGSWRYEGEMPALVLSKGGIWRPGKRPQGISYESLWDALSTKPESAYYEFRLSSGTLRSIDLLLDNSEQDRFFDHYPECGGDVLSTISKSRAIVLK